MRLAWELRGRAGNKSNSLHPNLALALPQYALSPNDSFVLTRQLSVVSSEGGECPNKMSTKRRVCEKKPAEPPLPRKNANEKLIQAETTETGTVWFDSPPPLFYLFFPV